MTYDHDKDVLSKLKLPPEIMQFISHLVEDPIFYATFQVVCRTSDAEKINPKLMALLFFTFGFYRSKMEVIEEKVTLQ